MKKSDNIIRVGDTVKIVNPQFFVRVGYPKSVSEETEIVFEKHRIEIEEFLKKFNVDDWIAIQKVAAGIAY
jgi:mannose-6-phosphate isomerase class I